MTSTIFADQLNQLYPDMLRFATIQLRDAEWAEDVVQETLTAAWDNKDQFQAASSLKTWLLSILKNKITDHFRQKAFTVSTTTLQKQNEKLDLIQQNCFDADGHWASEYTPQSWHETPDQYMQHRHFFNTLEDCMQKLPEDTARVFYLREIIGWDIAEISEYLNLSKENCYVILHRARNGLRLCLQHNWFDEQ